VRLLRAGGVYTEDIVRFNLGARRQNMIKPGEVSLKEALVIVPTEHAVAFTGCLAK